MSHTQGHSGHGGRGPWAVGCEVVAAMVAVGRGLWAVSYELWATACPICRDVDSFAVELGPGTVLLGDQISISNKEQVVLLGDGSHVPPKIDLQGGRICTSKVLVFCAYRTSTSQMASLVPGDVCWSTKLIRQSRCKPPTRWLKPGPRYPEYLLEQVYALLEMPHRTVQIDTTKRWWGCHTGCES